MKSKRLMQIVVVFALLFSTMGGSQSALASTNSAPLAEAMVINRNLNFWDATYIGFINASIHEKWHFDFTAGHTFVVTVTPITGTSDLIPLLILQDAGGAELARGTTTLTSTQSAGSYALQIQPESGSGFYVLTLREVLSTNPTVVTTISPASVNVGEVAVATVSLNNVPAEGYTSAEFTCTYNASLVDVGTPVATSLFGADPAVAVNEQTGSFIVAIAGSNGSKATTSGAAFTFSVTGLFAGQTPVECDARVSKGDNILTDIASTGTTLTITGSGPTATFTPVVSATPTSLTPGASPTATSLTPVHTATPTSTPVVSETPTSLTPVHTPTFTATSTPIETATPTITFTPVVSPTFTSTSTPLPNGSVTGQVLAGKPVTVGLYTGDTLVTSATAGNDGTFSLSAPAGTYTVRATASGFLSAQGSVTLTSGSNVTKPAVTLLAGDIDGNNVIDQFDALTIGMSYNTATPAAADLNNDNVINVLDLELLAQNYRDTGPTTW
jgi:hypothetical protein